MANSDYDFTDEFSGEHDDNLDYCGDCGSWERCQCGCSYGWCMETGNCKHKDDLCDYWV